ncbi:MAG TPA: CotH kinase family protein [Polyangiaceae bacterium]|nr:CotH kinase family protein [Polyangiaceae bacterium]
MARSVFRRVYRARPLHSFIMCLPAALLVAWYAWSAFANVDRYRRAVKETAPLRLETLHVALHDQLEADIRRMLMAPPPEPSSLYTYRLRVNRDDWDKLVDSAEIESDRPYVDAKVESDGRLLDAEVRLRGSRHWHVGGMQKSLKVKLDKGELIQGHRIFNLLNDPTPMVVGQQLILNLAEESEILTPVSSFVRLKLNSKDLGVYHYETAADESLLRSSRRMPGSIYASALPESAATDELWASSKHWTKVSSRTDSEHDRTDFSDLDRFLFHVHDASYRQFVDFASHELDLETFARLDAIDVAFGGDQRDFRENHDYYFDPYRGRWEPIAGGIRGFRDDREFNLVESPVLLRLKMTPGYLSRRDRLLYELLSDKAAPSAVQERATTLLQTLAPELRTDPYWDAYRELPRIDTFHRRMVRPNTLARLALVVESELVTYSHRHAQLVAELEKNPLYLDVGGPGAAPLPEAGSAALGAAASAMPNGTITPLSVVIDGHAGVALSDVSVSFASDCKAPSLSLWRAGMALPAHGVGGELALDHELALYPSVALVPRRDPSERRGSVRAELVPTPYPLTLLTSCAPQSVVVRGRHLATDSRVVSRPLGAELRARVPSTRLGPDAVPHFVAGEVAPHAWQLDSPAPRSTRLGPGEVVIDTTRVFEPDETVTVAPGTHLRMGPQASLIFLGQVRFEGEPGAPIVVDSLEARRWGGIALQGPGTAGSRLEHVLISAGTKPVWRSIPYPALINVHHTRDIGIKGCRFSQNAPDTDTLHVAYVDGLEASDTSVAHVAGDAFDLEYSRADLRRLRLLEVGDDGLDLMGSDVALRDSVILGAQGNGISAGEESAVKVQNTLIARCSAGVLAKNAAQIALSGSVLYQNETGVRSYQRTVRYSGDSEVTADVLFVAGTRKKPVKRDDREGDRLDRGRVLVDLPRPGALDHVLQDVLEIGSWQDLDRWIGEQRQEIVR